jgi:hypothetical protein
MKIYFQLLIIVCLNAWTSSLTAINPAIVNKNSFMQQPKLTVITSKVSDIQADKAKCSFNVQGSPITEKGVCFSETANPTISN